MQHTTPAANSPRPTLSSKSRAARSKTARRRRFLAACLALLSLTGAWFAWAQTTRKVAFELPLTWPEEQRAFLQDGPGLLLTDLQLEELLAGDVVDRERFIVEYLADDPLPATPLNELAEAVQRRSQLVHGEFSSFLDDRAKLLFLHGVPTERVLVDCAETFKPLELWRYGLESRPLVVYRDQAGEPYRLWIPVDGKRRIYNPEMEYWLEQWEELRSQIVGGRRFDRTICDQAKLIDEITGVDGIYGFLKDRPTNDELLAYLQPPDDLAAWAAKAAASEVPELPQLNDLSLELFYPERQGQRMLIRAVVTVPPKTQLQPYEEGDKKEYRLRVEGSVERQGKVFERFRSRYLLPVHEGSEGKPIALVINRRLRPKEEFLLRLRVVEEVTERQALLNQGFIVPSRAEPLDLPPVSDEVLFSIGEELAQQRIQGADSLVLIPPSEEVVFGLWRAEALVTGERIDKVEFYLDDAKQLSRRRPPFTAELRLATFPKEQTVRADGYDAEGELVASDEVVLNQPRGELRVRILEPARGKAVVAGEVPISAEVVVPEEARVASVEVFLNDDLQATLTKPPWTTAITMPPTGALTYITVAAQLEDGTRAEDVRFLNAPNYLEEIDVNLVELFTTVSDRSGRLAKDLVIDDFQVWEDGRPQKITKFELVDNLPLTLGITIDTSGSMYESLGEAQRAAVEFLDNIITPRDRCFALSFADRPVLLMPRTSDVGAVAERLQSLSANGSTSLHDAIVTSLYYYRGVRGRRAMVLLSDGEDTASSLGFAEALEYAKRSGVSIYTIGLRISKLDLSVRRKLENLAQETGGRTFFINDAVDLAGVYEDIERELRSQYLVAYSSDQGGEKGTYRQIKIEVKDGKLKARTVRGYYS